MTKSQEAGANEVTEEARREAARTGKDVCAILARLLKQANAARDSVRVKKIEKAQKYLGCRNVRKRKGK
jgi:ribosomal protein L18E